MTAAALTARIATFAATGTLSTTQDLVRTVLPALTSQANPELVAEETLVLTATVSARAAEVGLKHQPDALAALGPALAELPFLYHDYLLGAQLVAQGAEGEQEPDQSVYDRLARKAEFYAVHLAPGAFPGPRQLGDKMALWMGRISPPKLPTSPQARLESLELVEVMAAHARLVLAFAQRAAGD